MDRIGSFATESDLHGFQEICLLLQQNLEDPADDSKELSDDQNHALEQWTDDAGVLYKYACRQHRGSFHD